MPCDFLFKCAVYKYTYLLASVPMSVSDNLQNVLKAFALISAELGSIIMSCLICYMMIFH